MAVGKPLEAIPLSKLALETNPQIAQFWLSYIDALMRLERFEEAAREVIEAKNFGVCSETLESYRHQIQAAFPSKDQINHLMELYKSGRLAEAELVASSDTQKFPKHHLRWKVLEVVYKQDGRLRDSFAPLKKSVEVSPCDSDKVGQVLYFSRLNMMLVMAGLLSAICFLLYKILGTLDDFSEEVRLRDVTSYQKEGLCMAVTPIAPKMEAISADQPGIEFVPPHRPR